MAELERITSADPPSIDLCGIRFHAVSEAQLVERVASAARAGRGGRIVTPNLDYLRRLVREGAFREICAAVDLCVADGMPLVWASKLQRTPLPERVAGSNLIWSLNRRAASEGLRVFLLGGNPGTAERAAEVLCEAYPDLRIVGTHCPPVGFERNREQYAALLGALEAADPQLVFVALGAPKQERLIAELFPRWPHAWWIGVGISFSFVTGEVRRAPRWIQRLGLEWLHRLAQEPRRLFRRYLVDDLPFAFVLFARSAWRGLTAPRGARLRSRS